MLNDLCRSVVDVGASQKLLLSSGAYAQLAYAGKVPDLLSAIGTLSATGAPQFEPATGGWEPIRLGAIQDLVQAQFGPVDLDRSAALLDAVAEHDPACAACAGRRFGFPTGRCRARSRTPTGSRRRAMSSWRTSPTASAARCARPRCAARRPGRRLRGLRRVLVAQRGWRMRAALSELIAAYSGVASSTSVPNGSRTQATRWPCGLSFGSASDVQPAPSACA